jgi:hypothetical protein
MNPCPFCGQKAYKAYGRVAGCENDKCFIGQDATTITNWESAYCWKERDTLRQLCGELLEALRDEHEMRKVPFSSGWCGELVDRAEKMLKGGE